MDSQRLRADQIVNCWIDEEDFELESESQKWSASRLRTGNTIKNKKMTTPTSPTSIMTNPSSSMGTNNKRHKPPRPKITLNIPPPNASSQIQSPFLYPNPQSAMSGGTNKSSNYPQSEDIDMFKQIGNFTMAGLGHGERVIN